MPVTNRPRVVDQDFSAAWSTPAMTTMWLTPLVQSGPCLRSSSSIPANEKEAGKTVLSPMLLASWITCGLVIV